MGVCHRHMESIMGSILGDRERWEGALACLGGLSVAGPCDHVQTREAACGLEKRSQALGADQTADAASFVPQPGFRCTEGRESEKKKKKKKTKQGESLAGGGRQAGERVVVGWSELRLREGTKRRKKRRQGGGGSEAGLGGLGQFCGGRGGDLGGRWAGLSEFQSLIERWTTVGTVGAGC